MCIFFHRKTCGHVHVRAAVSTAIFDELGREQIIFSGSMRSMCSFRAVLKI